jgi:hypothetical protein
MQDLWWQFRDTDTFTVCTVLVFATTVSWFIYEIVGAPLLAWISAPILAAGGILGPTLLAHQMITLSYDPTINMVTETASGTLLTLILILLTNWLWTLFVEWRVSRTKLPALPARAPRIRR